MALEWELVVDWDGDGIPDTHEEDRIVGMSTRRGRKYQIKPDGSGFEPVMVGDCQITLNNLDGRYDPYNIASPIYPNVLPGRKFRLDVVDTLHAGSDIFTGWISVPRPTGNRGVERLTITGYDGMERLRKTRALTTLKTNRYVHEAVGDILTAVNWADGSSLDAFSDLMPYWWASDKAAQEIEWLMDASLGRFLIAAGGQAKFYSRLRTRPVLAYITETDIQIGIDQPLPWETVRNDISLLITSLTAQSTGTVWQLGDKPLVVAGDSLELWGTFSYNGASCPAQNVIDPVVTTDYLMNSAADGSGTNLSADFTVTATIYADRIKLVVANGGATDGYITLLKVRGDALTSTVTELNRQDSASIAQYENLNLTIGNKCQQSVGIANDLLTLMLDMFSDIQIYPTVRLRSNYLQFERDLFDYVNLSFPSKSISGNYVLAYIEHRWLEPTGQVVETTWGFEPPVGAASDYWVFPTRIGLTSKLGA